MNLSIKMKIVAVSSLAVVFSLMISIFAGLKTAGTLRIYQKVTEVNFPNVEALAAMEKAAILIESAANLLIGSNSTSDDAKLANEKLQIALKLFEDNAKKYEDLPFAPGEEAMWNEFKKSFWSPYVEQARNIVQLSATGKLEDREKRDRMAASEWKHMIESRDAAFDKLQDFQSSEVKVNSAEAYNQAHLLAWLVPVLLSTGGLISILLSYLLGTAIAKSLDQVSKVIDQSTLQVTSASSQIASTSQNLSSASTQQASSLEETATALEEITATVSKATENAILASQTSVESLKKAEEGKQVMDRMLVSMEQIGQSNDAILSQINDSNRQMTEIVKVIQDISIKTRVINEIVFQTKLLSFNASVEAARAGEHGKGFAVVAEEVGNLAQMSGNAAKEITEMLDSSMAKVEGIVRDTQSKVEILIQGGKEKVVSGSEVARQCSDLLKEIVQNASKVAALSQEISHSNKEQAQGISEINKAMAQLDTVTQQNAASSQHTATSAAALSAQAGSLQEAVIDLVSLIEGNKKQEQSREQEAFQKAA